MSSDHAENIDTKAFTTRFTDTSVLPFTICVAVSVSEAKMNGSGFLDFSPKAICVVMAMIAGAAAALNMVVG